MAEAAAAVRAAHHQHEGATLFDDPYAILLTSPGWRVIARNRWLFYLLVKRILKVLRPVHGQVLARSRYTEDRLAAAIDSGISQYVILAAGLDSFALRQTDFPTNLKIYEVDHPGTQQLKISRIKSLGIALPPNLILLPADFSDQTIEDVLAGSTFDSAQPAFVSWLGTVPYLTREVVLETLRAICTLCTPGSELVFDYASSEIEPQDQPAVDRLRAFAARRGEPLITQFDPQSLGAELENMGFEIIENISQSTWRLEYYAHPPTADLRPLSAAYIVHVRVR